MELSSEQQHIIDTITKEDVGMALVSACAGSGKSSSMVAVANYFDSCLYIVYSKAMQLEAEGNFGDNTLVKTLHGLAYAPIVKLGLSTAGIRPGPRTIDNFNYRNIDIPMSYTDKLQLIEYMEMFFASKYTSIREFISVYAVEQHIADGITKYIKAMAEKSIPCTFGFYLKYFHILLSRGLITMPSYDIVIIDELQDLSEVALEVFKLLDAPKKIGVGDAQQSIFAFNYCTNGFEYLKEDTDSLIHLTKSFRCSVDFAPNIEAFCKQYLDPEMEFKGTEHTDKTINSVAYISRTNASLIAKMIELNKHNTPYNLTRKASDIFSLLLTIVSLKPGAKIFKKEYKFLLEDMAYYNGNPHLKHDYPSLLSYIASTHSADKSIAGACRVIAKYGGQEIFKAYNICKAHESAKATHKLTLTSSHSSKGLTFDKVQLDTDLNLDYMSNDEMSAEDKLSEHKLRYVSITRAKHELLGASWLE